jgi:hypothetical protein
MEGRFARRSSIAAVAASLMVVAGAMSASAASLSLGSRVCVSPYPVVQTASFSTGTTTHTQTQGTTVHSTSFSNGTNIIHRYYSPGWGAANGVLTTTGAFQATGNSISCTN